MSSSESIKVPHAATTRRLRAKLKASSAAEALRSLVEAGIITPDGKLTRAYGGAKRARKRAA